ncbi:MAG TPA: isocitrate lyase/phosphoenolpyruvate mutase family protein [Candidatus Angelobacter sp.]|nr:isocitrate lyase/phosphoenolpyruvate mutase family protein [Candidatus Angelobacter sp.]
MTTQSDKAAAFKALHAAPGAFVIPNPWDVGSARMLTLTGYRALATTSAGLAWSLGRPDGGVGRDAALAHARVIVAASELPVSADLENGFGDAPADCAETVRGAAAAGLVGCSIEDSTGRAGEPIYAPELALARVQAAVAAARALPFPFTLTARAENFLHGRPDLEDTLRRLKAFAAAGADVLYAPGLSTREQIAAVVQAVAPKPVNLLASPALGPVTVRELGTLGVKRISVGGLLARAAYGAALRAAREIAASGTFGFAKEAVPFAELNGMFKP